MNENIKNDNQNKIKLLIFKKMVDLYHLYVDAINNSKPCAILVCNESTFILSQTDEQTKGIDLYGIVREIEKHLQPVSNGMNQNAESDNEDQANYNLIIPSEMRFLIRSGFKKFNKIKNTFREVIKRKDKRDCIPQGFEVTSYINDFSVFLYFLNQMKIYLNKHQEVLKLDFILTCAYYFFGTKQQFWWDLCSKKSVCFSQEQKQRSYEKYWVKWEDIKDVILQIRSVCSEFDFVISSDFVLNCIIKSGEKERYSVEDLNRMIDEFVFPAKWYNKKQKFGFACKLLDVLANNPNKTITLSNLPQDFINLLNIFVNFSEGEKKTNKKQNKVKDIANTINNLKGININREKAGMEKISCHELFVNILKKIRTQYSDDASYDINFVKKSWRYEVYSVTPEILEFMAAINFDALAVLLKKFCVSQDILEKKGFDMKLISGIIDKLYYAFINKREELKQQLATQSNVDGVTLFKSEYLKFVESIKFLYGNFLYPLLLHSSSKSRRLTISPSGYTKLVEITNELTAYGLLDGSYERELMNKAKKLEEDLKQKNTLHNRIKTFTIESGAGKNLSEHQNKIIENENPQENEKFDFENINRFDVYEINSKLIDDNFTKIKFDSTDDNVSDLNDNFLDLDGIFLWYKYIRCYGNASISTERLYEAFSYANAKTIGCYNDDRDLLLAVDFIIDILNGKKETNEPQNQKKIAISEDDFECIFRLTSNYADYLSRLLNGQNNNLNIGDAQKDIEKFYNLVEAAMSLYVDNLESVYRQHGYVNQPESIREYQTLTSRFIESFAPLFRCIENISGINMLPKDNYLYCKFYLTKAINAVECAFLKKQTTKTKKILKNK